MYKKLRKHKILSFKLFYLIIKPLFFFKLDCKISIISNKTDNPEVFSFNS